MTKQRNIEQELLEDLEAVKAHKRGAAALRTRTFAEVSPPGGNSPPGKGSGHQPKSRKHVSAPEEESSVG